MPKNLQSDSVVLHGVEINLDSTIGQQFVTDAVRAAEGLCSDKDLVEKYEIEPEEWRNITKNTTLIRAIQDERVRRVRNGSAAREAAAQHFIEAPAVLSEILTDRSENPRHRIESARELRATATSGAGAKNSADAGPTFKIVINLGSDTEVYEKEIAPMKPSPLTIEDKTDGDE